LAEVQLRGLLRDPGSLFGCGPVGALTDAGRCLGLFLGQTDITRSECRGLLRVKFLEACDPNPSEEPLPGVGSEDSQARLHDLI
jgi:hypothetical protein